MPGTTTSGLPESKSYLARLNDRWLSLAVCLVLAMAVWAVFGRTLHYGFVNYDDDFYVYKNPIVTGGLNPHEIVWVWTHDNGLGEWFPLTDISHMLDWQLYGLNAGGHHFTNVLLHTATAMLLFLVLRKLTGAFWRAAFVAAVFAVHPLRVESVAWVVERKDVLSGLFFMLTLWAWARYAQKRSREMNLKLDTESASRVINPRRWTPDYFLALIFFALGLLSKAMLVTLPFILLLLDYWPLNRLSFSAPGAHRRRYPVWAGLILEKAPFLLLSAAAGVATLLTQKHAFLAVQGSTLSWRAGNALLAYTDYLKHMIYPVGLALIYPRPETNLPLGNVVLSALVLIGVSIGVVVGQRKHPYLLVGWLCYLGMLVPVIDVMQAGDQARADRYTYLPQIGLYVMITWGVAELCHSRRYWRIAMGFAAAVILTGLLVGAYIQTGFWKDSVSLWKHTLACTPDCFLARNNLGLALADQGRLDEAIQQYDQALQLNPNSAYAHNNKGNALMKQGKLPEAIREFERAFRLNPNYAEACYNWGIALADGGKPDEAIQYYEKALQIKPDYADAHHNLGVILAGQGKLEEAIQHYEQVLQINPDDAEARYNLGGALARQGKLKEAIQNYERSLQLNPDYAEAHFNLGVALASEGNVNEGLQHIQQALNLATEQCNTALANYIRTWLKSSQTSLPQIQEHDDVTP
jgi:tetratricopeptide (TPR) repeat protein